MKNTWQVVTKQHIFAPETWFASCHASTIAAFEDGDLVAAWFAGTREGHEDVGIWLSRYHAGVWSDHEGVWSDHEGVWSDPVKVAQDPQWPCWNPVLQVDKFGTVHLYYKVGKDVPNWRTMVMHSTDHGQTFSSAQELVLGDIGGRGPVKNKILVCQDTWFAPASIETATAWDAFVELSCDHGRTFRSVPVPFDHTKSAGLGVIQPTLWVSSQKDLHMLLRSCDGVLYRSDSHDFGENWCVAYPTDLPNNNSGIDAVRVGETVALVYNPVGANWGTRTPLVCAFSSDNGKTFAQHLTLDHTPPPAEREDCEYSYPAIIEQGGRLLITYTWRRKSIAYVELVDR